MKTIIKSICLISALSAFSNITFAENATTNSTTTTSQTTTTTAASSASAIAGNYQCQRTDASGTNTAYTLSITNTGSTYTFEWDANGTPTLYGTGVIHPSAPNAVSVVFWDIASTTGSYGNELFFIKPDGSLQGNLVLRTGTTLGSETCTKSAS